ncbi:MAG: tRNA threonylcarbamoyladenosine dehydratase [Bacteroidales bacterium]|nr:tRNA threonylcarbamoyladenosine dehydratase [Bacteroidales bacterium]
MTSHWLERTEQLVQKKGLDKLLKAHVLIAGLGGVGSWAAEFICRAGVGELSIIDHDIIKESNRNRQLCALKSTEGLSKIDVMSKRLLDINTELKLNSFNVFLKDEKTPELIEQLKPDYIIDAIDTLSPKVFLIHYAVTHNYQIISSLGAGGRIDPTRIQVADISKSHACRLAFYMRKRLRKLGISSGFKVVFSSELVSDEAIIPIVDEDNKKSTVGTISYLPAIMGGFCAGEVVKDILSTP